MDAMQKSRMRTMETRVMTEMANEASIIDTVVRAHFDTCDYTADKIQPFINKAKVEQAFTHVSQSSGMVSRSPPPLCAASRHRNDRHVTFVTEVQQESPEAVCYSVTVGPGAPSYCVS